MTSAVMCSRCGGPLTRGVDAVAREMARRQNDSVFTGVTFGTHPGEVFCWACAYALADDYRQRLREKVEKQNERKRQLRQQHVVRLRASRRRYPRRDAQMYALRKQGVTYRQIAEQHGLSPTRVWTLVYQQFLKECDTRYGEPCGVVMALRPLAVELGYRDAGKQFAYFAARLGDKGGAVS